VQEAHDTAGEILGLMTVSTAQGNAGNQFVGKLETLPTVSVLTSETTEITEVTPVSGQAALAAKSLASYGRHSRAWALQSEAGAAALTRLHVNAVKSKTLQQILEGSGSNGQLLGLTANSGVPTAAGTSVDWAKTCTAMESVEKTGSGPFAWVVSAAAAKLLRQRAQISGGEAILRDGRIGGYPCYVTGCTTNAIAAFGSWTDLQVFQWRPLEVAIDPFSDFQSASIGMRAWASVDAAPMLLNSFYTLTAIT
jgi:HK97 family phage major capsid protein